MAKYRKQPGTPTYHSTSTRKGQQAKPSVTRTMRIPAEIERENQMRAFKTGAMLGFALESSCVRFSNEGRIGRKALSVAVGIIGLAAVRTGCMTRQHDLSGKYLLQEKK